MRYLECRFQVWAMRKRYAARWWMVKFCILALVMTGFIFLQHLMSIDYPQKWFKANLRQRVDTIASHVENDDLISQNMTFIKEKSQEDTVKVSLTQMSSNRQLLIWEKNKKHYSIAKGNEFEDNKDGYHIRSGEIDDEHCPVSIFQEHNRTFSETCEFVYNHHGCDDNAYLKLLFCGLGRKELSFIYFGLCLILLMFLFYLLGSTVEEYFGPALLTMSNTLNMEPNVAGVTLLALGNCIPEITAIIISVARASDGVGFGALTGGGFFVTTFVFACVILLSPAVQTTRRPFFRDSVFYFGSVSIVFFIYWRGKIYIWESVLFFFIYILYVLVVIVGQMIYQKMKKANKDSIASDEDDTDALINDPNQELSVKGETIPILDFKPSKNFGTISSPTAAESELPKSDKYYGKSREKKDRPILAKESKIRRRAYFLPSFGIITKAIVSSKSEASDDEDEDIKINKEGSANEDCIDETTSKAIKGEGYDKNNRDYENGSYSTLEESSNYRSPKFKSPSGKPKSKLIVIDDHTFDLPEHDFFVVTEEDYQPSRIEEDKKMGEDFGNLEQKSWRSSPGVFFKKFLREIGWTDRKRWYQKICFICFEAVAIFIRNLTIPNGNPREWNKWFTAAVPVFSPFVILFAIGASIGKYDLMFYLVFGYIPLPLIPLPIGVIASVFILLTTSRYKTPAYYPILLLYSFLMSVVWIVLCASQLIMILESLGFVLNVNPAALAITVLSWGDCLGDLIADVSISRRGFPSMAIGAVFGSPLLTLLIGSGISLTAKLIFIEKSYCTVIVTEAPILIMFLFILGSVLISIVIVPICRFTPRKPYGVLLLLWYMLGIGLTLFATFYHPFGDLLLWKITPGQGSCDTFL